MDTPVDGDAPHRPSEVGRLLRFVDQVRGGQGGGLVVLGEHGSGKSSLARALTPDVGVRVVTCTARPGEHAQDLLARLLPGVGPADPDGDDGLVGAADSVLRAIGTVSATGPVVWVVDDLELADRSARRLLGYVARRLSYLPAGVVLVGWQRGAPLPAGVPVLRLHPLPDVVVADVVRARLGAAAPDWVVTEVAAAAGGNPLAARELADALSPEEVAGRSVLPMPPRPGPSWAAHGDRLARRAGRADRTALLVVAVGDGLGIEVLERACALLDTGPAALGAVEARRLVRVDGDGRCWARRPHRSAVLHAATEGERRRVHGALAAALAPGSMDEDPDVRFDRARHRAAAADDGDDGAGRELECALREVRASPAAVAGWIRAAALADDPADRVRRIVLAAQCSWQVGRPSLAAALVELAGLLADGSPVAGTAALVRGVVALGHGLPADALEVLTEGARAAAPQDPELAVDLVARSAGVAWWSGRIDWADRAVELAATVGAPGPYAGFVREATAAGAAVLRGDHGLALADLGPLLAAAAGLTEPRGLIFASEVAGLVGDDLLARHLLDRAVQALRAAGRVTDLPFALQLAALGLAGQGRTVASRASAEEGLLLAVRAGEDAGGPFQQTVLAHLDALEGSTGAVEDRWRALGAPAEDRSAASLAWARGRLAVSQERMADAVEVLRPVVLGRGRHPVVGLLAAPDLVEAADSTGDHDLAAEAVARFGRWRAAGSRWAGAVEPRLLAVLGAPEHTDVLFDAACRAPGLADRPLEAARTRLAYGTSLRARRRKAEAREQLHLALGLFESLGLPAWTARTRAALRASGEAGTAKARPAGGPLTRQELEIVRLVSAGFSNRDVAGQLHLSSRTIEYHLSKVYVKLGLSSRDQLGRALADLS